MDELEVSGENQVVTSDSGAAAHTGASVRTYLTIGVILAIFTAVEVQVPGWLASNRPLMITTLLVLAFTKAAFVVLYYMHLKFESRVYAGVILLAAVMLSYFLVLVTL